LLLLDSNTIVFAAVSAVNVVIVKSINHHHIEQSTFSYNSCSSINFFQVVDEAAGGRRFAGGVLDEVSWLIHSSAPRENKYSQDYWVDYLVELSL
jgi:hypothetical protein